MAILDSIPGLEVWVNVDGEPATEYDDPNDEAQGMGLSEFDVLPDHGPEPPYIIKRVAYTLAGRCSPEKTAGTDEHFEHDIRPHSGNDGNTGAHITAEKAVKKGNAVDCKTARPFAVFEFRYRSREDLIKEGIIPDPSPEGGVGDTRGAEVNTTRRASMRVLDVKNKLTIDSSALLVQ
ncbi:predicted protein [Chaetomium globosum CBS 148.51]|uniref:DUF7918 domain-containing protein n=1 Tax=Chaetomium globosum (strain ATCC 6205 / CBS 148.51 / DSM 1962 / NBRC 6347 / NRRL 1970) TaxID=306901 RepID=Q2HCL3_CHAGB|nr:uncharacterized protein CHGG_02041 [Chaetomium globosum CBS 148.51]EAQ93806.1 predicted protein [Chaetomium globosum CBS 148.51]